MISWQLRMSLSGDKEHSRLYRGEYQGKDIQYEVHTPVKTGYHYSDPNRFGKPTRHFFLDNDPREFHTEEELKAAVDEIVESKKQ